MQQFLCGQKVPTHVVVVNVYSLPAQLLCLLAPVYKARVVRSSGKTAESQSIANVDKARVVRSSGKTADSQSIANVDIGVAIE